MSRDVDIGRSAIEDPISYPGELHDRDYVLLAGASDHVAGRYYSLRTSPDREPGEAEIIDPGPGMAPTLGAALEHAGAAPIADRHALVAYGSNASPHQLGRKLAAAPGVSAIVPALRARVHDHDVVYSAHVSSYGAVPATLHESPGTTTTAALLLVDTGQLDLIAATEAKNYVMLRARFEIEVDARAGVDPAFVFVSRHGVLLVDGAPRRLDAVECVRPRFEAVDHAGLVEVVNARVSGLGTGRVVTDCVPDAVAAGTVPADAVTEALEAGFGSQPARVAGERTPRRR